MCLSCTPTLHHFFLNLSGRLDFLAACEPPTPRLDVPSWVPDWPDTRHKAQIFVGLLMLAPFAAGGEMPLQAKADPTGKTLKLKGRFWDTITFKCSLDHVEGATGLVVLFICVLIYAVLQSGICVGHKFTQMFVRTLTAGFVKGNGPTRPRTTEETRRVADWIESTAIVKTVRADIARVAGDLSQMKVYFNAIAKMYATGVSNGEDLKGDEEKYQQGVLESCATCTFMRRSRALFVTQEQKLVLGGIAAKRGDTLFIPAGGQVPIAVRHIDDGSYRFLCECFVQGIMSGQALRGLAVEDLESVELR